MNKNVNIHTMKAKIFIIFILILIALFSLESCMTLKPRVESVSEPDYNSRRIITNPYYVKKTNILGKAFPVISAVGFGALGYLAAPVYVGGLEGIHSLGWANIAIGASLGFVIGNYGNFLAGEDKIIYPNDFNDWLSKANSNYIYLRKNGSSFLVINRDIEPIYTVKKLQDVYDFHNAFPNSKYVSSVIRQAADVLPRKDLPYVVNLYPDVSDIILVKKAYVLESTTLKDMFDAYDRYSAVHNIIDLQKEGLPLIKSLDDVNLYIKRFPEGKYYKDVEAKAVGFVQNVYDAKYYNKIFSRKSYYADSVEKKLAGLAKNIQDAQAFANYYKNSKYAYILINNLYKKFGWDDLVKLISLYPNHPLTSKMISRLLSLANSIERCGFIYHHYPGFRDQALQKAISMVNAPYDIEDFKKYLTNEQVTIDSLINKIYLNLSPKQLITLIDNNPYSSLQNILKMRLINITNSLDDLQYVIDNYEDVKEYAVEKAKKIIEKKLEQIYDLFNNNNCQQAFRIYNSIKNYNIDEVTNQEILAFSGYVETYNKTKLNNIDLLLSELQSYSLGDDKEILQLYNEIYYQFNIIKKCIYNYENTNFYNNLVYKFSNIISLKSRYEGKLFETTNWLGNPKNYYIIKVYIAGKIYKRMRIRVKEVPGTIFTRHKMKIIDDDTWTRIGTYYFKDFSLESDYAKCNNCEVNEAIQKALTGYIRKEVLEPFIDSLRDNLKIY